MEPTPKLQEKITEALLINGPLTKADLAQKTEYSIHSISHALAALGNKGKVKQSKGIYTLRRTDGQIIDPSYLVKEMVNNRLCQMMYMNRSRFDPSMRKDLLPAVLCFILADDPNSIKSEFWTDIEPEDLNEQETRKVSHLVNYLNSLFAEPEED